MDQVKEEVMQVRSISSTADKQDQFVSRMEIFLRQAEVLMKSTQNQMTDLQREMEELVRYFGQESNPLKPELLFGTLTRFKSEFEHTTAELGFDEFREGDYSLENSFEVGQGNELNGQVEPEAGGTQAIFSSDKLPSTPIGQGRITGGTQSRRHTRGGTGSVVRSGVGKGGLDVAIREIRTGSKLRPLHFFQREVEDSPTPASRIFLTG
ncbi:hypothetical protein PGT21_015948 [Puccinia graminis f. sp. tritici]|uniref:FH2 domain-containing protein n=1 Tax=Puccinia graminis f. sp. tritici TaxID=56615 RepID=A0A5B0PI31_PUCGR|nr:hypothetical protein PGT21_015948 [Puccinia graminis f. sp. tritici]KAA1136685.1 hypothetical protein PGTUg99_037126 [Puccinia graminis f. sp. tritici]